MLSLKSSVENKTDQLCQSNTFLVGAQKGELSQQQIYEYLGGLRYLFDAFQKSIQLAEHISKDRGDADLAHFFGEKYKEEQGHSNWAESDMRHFEEGHRRDESAALHQARRFVGYLHELLHEDPKLFVPFMYTLEYFTVLAGPVLLNALREKQGIASEKLSAVANHVKLDTPHVEDDFKEMARWAQDASVIQRFNTVIEVTMEHVDRYLHACTLSTN